MEIARQALALLEDREAALLGEEAGVFERHRERIGHELQQLHVDRGERPLALDVDHPERPAGVQDRNGELGAHGEP